MQIVGGGLKDRYPALINQTAVEAIGLARA